MQKILLLGKNGMLGQAIQQNYELRITNYEFVSWDRRDLDITNKKQVIKKISELSPDVVINATGYTDVDSAESDRQTAFKVNADGVGYIAEACSQIGAHLIHFSTDYVFDGSRAQGYVEDDVRYLGPLNVYGKSKLIGEENVKIQMSSPPCFAMRSGQANVKSNPNVKCQRFFIIRTSWLYGAGGKNFVDAMLKRAIDGQTQFEVVNDQWGFPTYTIDLAERVLWMIDRIGQLESGVYHCTNAERKGSEPQRGSEPFHPAGITWHQFALEIFRQAKRFGILSKLPKVKPCSSDEFPRPAIRPKYGALINTKLPEMREWRKALREFLISNF